MYAFAINMSGAPVFLLLLSSLLARGIDRHTASLVQQPQQGFNRNGSAGRTGPPCPLSDPEQPLVTEEPRAALVHKSLFSCFCSISFIHWRLWLGMVCKSWECNLARSKPMTRVKMALHSPKSKVGTVRRGCSYSKSRYCKEQTAQMWCYGHWTQEIQPKAAWLGKQSAQYSNWMVI